MKKGMIPKFSMALALAAALALGPASRAHADLDDAVSYTEPRGVLVMPFDVTDNHESFQLVSRIGTTGGDVIASHWAYWSKDCRHLADVFICLTRDDTVVVDPKALRGQIQSPNPPQNNPVGPSFNLVGEQGFVVVSAYEANTDPGGLGCSVSSPDGDFADDELVGAWTIADTSTNAAFGSDAIGLVHQTVPSAGDFLVNGIFLQTFNPETLGDSDVILIGLEFPRGSGRFRNVEFGPIANRGKPFVSCDSNFTDNLENTVSLVDVTFDCALFAPITGAGGIIPGSATIDSSGFLHLENCTVLLDDIGDCGEPAGGRCPIDEEVLEQFIFAFHGQAVGQFGAVVSGKYSGT